MDKLNGRINVDKCCHCNKRTNDEGDDFCLGHLDESIVMNACCGHGVDEHAYVQFWDSECIRGEQAINKINELKGKE